MGEVAAAPARTLKKVAKQAGANTLQAGANLAQDPFKTVVKAGINPLIPAAEFANDVTGGFFQPGIRREDSQSVETNTGFLQSDINRFLQEGSTQSIGRTGFTTPEEQQRQRVTTTTRRIGQFGRELSPLTSIAEQEGFGSLVAFDQLEAFKKAFTQRKQNLQQIQRQPGQVRQTRRS